MKILCICEHGNIRSVTLAYILKTLYGYDALACGTRETSLETKEMLCKWADKIILVDKDLLSELLPSMHDKIIIMDIGKDIWHEFGHQGLVHKILKGLREIDV